MTYKVAIVGATGAVGQELIELLRERNFDCEIIAMASSRSAGKEISYRDEKWTVVEATPEAFEGIDVALFSAGGSITKTMAPEAAKRGCIVIDNSSAFRMDDDVPLIVPEINPDAVSEMRKNIIANPNCTTAITLMGLYPLHKEFEVKRVTASSYQAVSGSGWAAVEELKKQAKDWVEAKEMTAEAYPHEILFNLLPQIADITENGYTSEEMKMQNEGRKIMDHSSFKASCTCVRVPVFRAHSISINAEFEKDVDVEKARELIKAFPGVELRDDVKNEDFPMPKDYSGKYDCAVGRIRKDIAFDNGLSFWVVGDQLWKGAALNAVQIAELLRDKGILNK